MQSFVILLCTGEIVALIVGTALALAFPGGSDAAGRAMGAGYLVIGVTLLLFFVLPALWLARSGHLLWLAAALSFVAAIPALVLGIGSLVAAGEALWKGIGG